MRLQFLPALVAVALVSSTTVTASSPSPGSCVRDDLFIRLISVDKADRGVIRAFCREHLGIPAATWYSGTVTPTVSVESTETTTTTLVEETTITSVETVVSTSVMTTVVSTATQTVDAPNIQPAIANRDSQPTSLPQILAAEYEPAALSSACSCLSLRKCTKKGGLATASPTTTTIVSLSTVEVTSTSSTTTATTTTTGTTTTTDITVTTTVEAPATTASFAAVVTFQYSNEPQYIQLKPSSSIYGESFVLTKDVAQAVPFWFDEEKRLAFHSVRENATAYLYYDTDFLLSNNANVLYTLAARPIGALKQKEIPLQWTTDEDQKLQIVGGGSALTLQLAWSYVPSILIEDRQWMVMIIKTPRYVGDPSSSFRTVTSVKPAYYGKDILV